MKRKTRYRLPMEEETSGGRVSMAMGSASLALFILAILIAAVFAGKAGVPIGAFGLSGVLLSLGGFIAGLFSLREKNKNHRLSAVGAMGSGILLVFWLALFLMGVS